MVLLFVAGNGVSVQVCGWNGLGTADQLAFGGAQRVISGAQAQKHLCGTRSAGYLKREAVTNR